MRRGGAPRHPHIKPVPEKRITIAGTGVLTDAINRQASLLHLEHYATLAAHLCSFLDHHSKPRLLSASVLRVLSPTRKENKRQCAKVRADELSRYCPPRIVGIKR